MDTPRQSDGMGAVLASVRAIQQQLDRMEARQERQHEKVEAWQAKHVDVHTNEVGPAKASAVSMEGRLTRLEGAVTIRSWVGGVGLVLGALISGLTGGLGGKPS